MTHCQHDWAARSETLRQVFESLAERRAPSEVAVCRRCLRIEVRDEAREAPRTREPEPAGAA